MAHNNLYHAVSPDGDAPVLISIDPFENHFFIDVATAALAIFILLVMLPRSGTHQSTDNTGRLLFC